MSKILLVGINHHVAKKMSDFRLMDDECEKDFETRVLPQIEDTSIVFAEGHFSGVIRSDHSEYDTQMAKVSASLKDSGKRPTLAFVDPRARIPYADSEQLLRDVQGLILFGTAFLSSPEKPQNADEVAELIRIKKDSIRYRVKVPVPHMLRAAANRVRRHNDAFDAMHIARMTSAAKQHSSCFLIAGAAHCLSLYAKTDWPLIILQSPGTQDPAELFGGYLNVQLLPRVINKLSS